MLAKSAASILLAVRLLDVPNHFAWLPHRRAIPTSQSTPGAFQQDGVWYVLTPKLTWCNCYVSAFCACFGAELPARLVGDQLQWLESPGGGGAAGWVKLASREAARQRVEAGGLVLVITTAKIPHGHIAIGVPSPVHGEFHVTAAGATNTRGMKLESSFGSYASELSFFEHLPPV